MTAEVVRLEYRDKTAVVVLDRPDKRNALNAAMFSRLETVVDRLRANPPRAVILTGAGGKAFCTGFDVHPDNPMSLAILKAAESKDPSPALQMLGRIRQVTDALANLPVPLIAAVNGQAFGGGAEIAVRCDLRVMDPQAVICFSETRMGLMPDFGGTPHLVRLVGPSAAADLILAARRISAVEALEMGLANRVSAPGKALDESLALAATIAANGPRAVRAALEVIRRSPDLTLEEALALELDRAAGLIATGEFIHGVSAFLEKKAPEFPD